MVCWKCNGTGIFFIVYDVMVCDDCGGLGIVPKKEPKNEP